MTKTTTATQMPIQAKPKNKHTAPNPKHNRLRPVINTIHIGHTPVKIHTIISTTPILKRHRIHKKTIIISINMTNSGNKKQTIIKSQVSIDNRNVLDPRPLGKSFSDRNNINNKRSTNTKLRNKSKWGISWRPWEDLPRLIMCFGPGIISGTMISSMSLDKWKRREKNN